MNRIPESPAKRDQSRPRGRFWLLLVGFIVTQLVAWTIWFIIAAHHPVAEVPLQAG